VKGGPEDDPKPERKAWALEDRRPSGKKEARGQPVCVQEQRREACREEYNEKTSSTLWKPRFLPLSMTAPAVSDGATTRKGKEKRIQGTHT